MLPVRISQKKVWIGDEPHALLSGELHYWRLNQKRSRYER